MNSLKRFCILGAIVTVIFGVISHFVYEWSGNNFFAGLFFPVNESTWEHMKLLFFPMLAYAFIAEFDGVIPGLSEIECGNYLEHDLNSAKKDVLPLLERLENYTEEMLNYEYHF